MKKLFLALLLTGFMFAANAATIDACTPPTVNFTDLKKIADKNPDEWELHFSCDGGNTWGTFCCFDSEAEALAFWEDNEALLCSWANGN